jgi:hypothetical protein
MWRDGSLREDHAALTLGASMGFAIHATILIKTGAVVQNAAALTKLLRSLPTDTACHMLRSMSLGWIIFV